MEIAIYLYDGMTALDAVGPYDILNRIPGAGLTFVGDRAGPKEAVGGLGLVAQRDFRDVTMSDVVLIPGGGGPGLAREMRNKALLDWIKSVDGTTQWTTSVCTGSIILGAAGLLEGAEATTHWRAREYLSNYGATYVDRRVVQSGKVITGAGVSAGIDMALVLAERLAGEDVARAIQLSAHYDPQPPYQAIHHEQAPAEMLELINERLGPEDSR